MTTAGKFVWFELVTTDRAKSEAFYGEVLGWKTAAMPMGDHSYTLINNGATAVGGLVAAQGKEPSHWISYVAVPDVDQALAKVKAAGGKTTGPAIDVPTVGRMAEIADPQGAALYVFTPSGAEQPPQQVAGAFFWNELWTSDPAAALRFYEGVVGYGHTDKDMGPRGTYHVLTQGDRQLAGIMTAATPPPRARPATARPSSTRPPTSPASGGSRS
jgi:predicted enzyme related to lactoylglutathione lyase